MTNPVNPTPDRYRWQIPGSEIAVIATHDAPDARWYLHVEGLSDAEASLLRTANIDSPWNYHTPTKDFAVTINGPIHDVPTDAANALLRLTAVACTAIREIVVAHRNEWVHLSASAKHGDVTDRVRDGWTTHGHRIDGVPQTGVPTITARCGGPTICGLCTAEAEAARR